MGRVWTEAMIGKVGEGTFRLVTALKECHSRESALRLLAPFEMNDEELQIALEQVTEGPQQPSVNRGTPKSRWAAAAWTLGASYTQLAWRLGITKGSVASAVSGVYRYKKPSDRPPRPSEEQISQWWYEFWNKPSVHMLPLEALVKWMRGVVVEADTIDKDT